uniref:Ion_trans domain-containing protein n=1 Tax=Ascaris lumbricoides TaxID=6252 RepID=A0A0M3HTJ5_ASCLU
MPRDSALMQRGEGGAGKAEQERYEQLLKDFFDASVVCFRKVVGGSVLHLVLALRGGARVAHNALHTFSGLRFIFNDSAMFLICVKLLVCLPTEFYMHYFFGERGGEGRGTVSLWLYSLITILLLLSFNILAELFYCCNKHLLCKTYC